MIQDCTRVPHLACPARLPHYPDDLLIALCHSFLRTLHTNRIDGLKIIYTRKRIKRGWTPGRKEEAGWGLRHASSHSDRPVTAAGGSGGPAGLQPLQGTWSLGLSFEGFLSYTMIPKRGGKRNPLSHEEGWIMWRKKRKPNTQSAVWQASVLTVILSPEQLKTGH